MSAKTSACPSKNNSKPRPKDPPETQTEQDPMMWTDPRLSAALAKQACSVLHSPQLLKQNRNRNPKCVRFGFREIIYCFQARGRPDVVDQAERDLNRTQQQSQEFIGDNQQVVVPISQVTTTGQTRGTTSQASSNAESAQSIGYSQTDSAPCNQAGNSLAVIQVVVTDPTGSSLRVGQYMVSNDKEPFSQLPKQVTELNSQVCILAKPVRRYSLRLKCKSNNEKVNPLGGNPNNPTQIKGVCLACTLGSAPKQDALILSRLYQREVCKVCESECRKVQKTKRRSSVR